MSRLIILDWNRTLFDPDTQTLCLGASELLQALSSQATLVLVSRAEGSDPRPVLEQAGLGTLFTEVITAKEKTPLLFEQIKAKYLVSNAWVIGDKLDSEIVSGNRAGFTTIRVKQGKFADAAPRSVDEQPSFECATLLDCLQILSV